MFAVAEVAQMVERGPEKAGVGGSIPSLGTLSFHNLSDSLCKAKEHFCRFNTLFALSIRLTRSLSFSMY